MLLIYSKIIYWYYIYHQRNFTLGFNKFIWLRINYLNDDEKKTSPVPLPLYSKHFLFIRNSGNVRAHTKLLFTKKKQKNGNNKVPHFVRSNFRCVTFKFKIFNSNF